MGTAKDNFSFILPQSISRFQEGSPNCYFLRTILILHCLLWTAGSGNSDTSNLSNANTAEHDDFKMHGL